MRRVGVRYMSTRRTSKLYTKKQGRSENGQPLCLVCDGVIIDPRRKTFCSQACSDNHYIRTRPDFARLKVFERDHGICALCGIDTMANRIGPKHSRGTGHLWQADHIIPVVEGGGECTLDNLRTLCTSCHKSETAALAGRRAKQKSCQESASDNQFDLFAEVA